MKNSLGWFTTLAVELRSLKSDILRPNPVKCQFEKRPKLTKISMTANAKIVPDTSSTVVDIWRSHHDDVMTPNYAPMNMIPERGEGAWLWDTNGNAYLDFAAGIAVSALGHAHPVLCKALSDQAAKYWHVSNLLTNAPAIELAQKLCAHTFAERVFFANSGAEANEAALKLARRYAHDHFGAQKSEIIAFHNGFHGRTFFTVSVGGQPKYSDGFGPKPGDITHLPFNDIDALRSQISEKTCAVILEPIQGEGGVNPADQKFLEAVRELCDQFKALLIFDEVQTGAGRTGKLYAYQHFGITPDIMSSAKGLGGGFPIGAMLTTEAIGDSFGVGTHGSTFGGNPMGCAVASALLKIVAEDEFLQAVEEKGIRFENALKNLNRQNHVFSEVRGIGLLIGCELSGALENRAGEVVKVCAENGLLILQAGANVVRLAPPLVLSQDQIDKGIAILQSSIERLTNR